MLPRVAFLLPRAVEPGYSGPGLADNELFGTTRNQSDATRGSVVSLDSTTSSPTSRATADTRTPTTMVPDTAAPSPVSSYCTYPGTASSPVSSHGPVSNQAASTSTTMVPTSQRSSASASPSSIKTGAPSPCWTVRSVRSTPGFIGFARWPVMEDETQPSTPSLSASCDISQPPRRLSPWLSRRIPASCELTTGARFTYDQSPSEQYFNGVNSFVDLEVKV